MYTCRGPTEEVERILRVQKNYYAVLKVAFQNSFLRASSVLLSHHVLITAAGR